MSLYYVFNTMLLTLFVFHVYWWILICSMIMRQLKNRGKVGEDIRSGKNFCLLNINLTFVFTFQADYQLLLISQANCMKYHHFTPFCVGVSVCVDFYHLKEREEGRKKEHRQYPPFLRSYITYKSHRRGCIGIHHLN